MLKNKKSNTQTPQLLNLKPFKLINKLQESPSHKNLFSNHQIRSNILPQPDSPYQLLNSITSSRSNSQIYKQISKNFLQNLNDGIDQCLLFIGTQTYARLQSSIGTQNDPGIFMIAAVAVLDQKYKEKHENFEVEFSFLQFKNSKIYDLINYTQLPLDPKYKNYAKNKECFSNLQFCEHRVKFIKLFKIALYNNKQRETSQLLKNTTQNLHRMKQLSSSFIMKIRVKKYNNDSKLILDQQTILIDLNEKNLIGKNLSNTNQKCRFHHKQVIQRIGISSKGRNNRSLIDFLLIEMNGSNYQNKKTNYHLANKNLIEQILKKYLRKVQAVSSKTIFKKSQKNNILSFLSNQEPNQKVINGSLLVINSFTNSPCNYEQNIKLYQNLQYVLDQDYQVKYLTKKRSNPFDFEFINNLLKNIIDLIKYQKYESFEDFHRLNQFCRRQTESVISAIKLYCNIISDYQTHKRNLAYNKNVFIAYQLQLIGSCIKSDNIKDFYNSKSYIGLQRQIELKTQRIKAQIIEGTKNLKQKQLKYITLKKKQIQYNKQKKNYQSNKSLTTLKEKYQQKHETLPNLYIKKQFEKKFKIIQLKQNLFQKQLKNPGHLYRLQRYIIDYLNQIWNRAVFEDECTISQQIVIYDLFLQQMKILKEKLTNFIQQVKNIDINGIRCINSRIIDDKINSIQSNGFNLESRQFMAKNKSKEYRHQQQAYRNQVMQKNKNVLSFVKRDNNAEKTKIFQIEAKINFETLILTPKIY